MRALIALIAIVYLVGVGVLLSPIVQAGWSSGTPSNLFASVGEALPNTPAGVYHSMTNHG